MPDFGRLQEQVDMLSERISDHEIRLVQQHGQLSAGLSTLAAIERKAATTEQLAAAQQQIGLQLKNLQDTVDPIRKGIFWIVTLVLGAVVVALLALVIKGGAPLVGP